MTGEERKPSLNWLVEKPDRYVLPKMKLPIFIKELKKQGRLEVLNELQNEIERLRHWSEVYHTNPYYLNHMLEFIEKLKAEK